MAPSASSRRQVPFWGHQLAEYALAAALVVIGAHVSGRSELVLLVSGGVLAVLAAFTKGPLGAVHLIGKRLHVVLDLFVAAALFACPVFYLPHLPLIPIVISEATAVVVVRMSFTTELVPPPRPQAGAGNLGSGAPRAAPTTAETAGRLLGTAVGRARRSQAPLTAARGLGRMTGHARRLGRAAANGSAGTPRGTADGTPPAQSTD